MKWKKRQREIKRLRAEHAGKRWQNPFPNLKEGLRPLPPCNNILELYGSEDPSMKQAICSKCGKVFAHRVPDDAQQITCWDCDNPKAKKPIVDHFHKSGLQVILPSELPWAGGKKP